MLRAAALKTRHPPMLCHAFGSYVPELWEQNVPVNLCYLSTKPRRVLVATWENRNCLLILIFEFFCFLLYGRRSIQQPDITLVNWIYLCCHRDMFRSVDHIHVVGMINVIHTVISIHILVCVTRTTHLVCLYGTPAESGPLLKCWRVSHDTSHSLVSSWPRLVYGPPVEWIAQPWSVELIVLTHRILVCLRYTNWSRELSEHRHIHAEFVMTFSFSVS
jgi:hypothetical protein